MAAEILVVDDEKDIRELIGGILEDEGYSVRLSGSADEAVQMVRERKPALVLLDIWLQGSRIDGLEVLGIIKELHKELPVIMISGHGNVDAAVRAIKLGAYDYLEKPFKTNRLLIDVSKALEFTNLHREVTSLRAKDTDLIEYSLMGNSAASQQLRSQISKVANTNSRVLLYGPAGIGKEHCAQFIHQNSARANASFFEVNVLGASESHLMDLLFGRFYPDGKTVVGYFEAAHGGTLFIDELSGLPLSVQREILNLFNRGFFIRPGDQRQIHTDVRLICGTGRQLDYYKDDQFFPRILFDRIAVSIIEVPALSKRRSDIPELVNQFIARQCTIMGIQLKSVDETAMAVLQSNDWPGNIRQLKNAVERILLMVPANKTTICATDIPSDLNQQLPSSAGSTSGETLLALPLREARNVFERDYLLAQVERFDGSIKRAAQFIDMNRSALHRKLKLLLGDDYDLKLSDVDEDN